MREVEMIPEVHEDLGCYHWVYISLHFIEENEVNKKEDQVGLESDPDKEEIEDLFLHDEIERHWRMFLGQKCRGGWDEVRYTC